MEAIKSSRENAWGTLARSAFALAVMSILAGSASAFNPAEGDFAKPASNLVRVMSWNVHNNFIYASGKDGSYSRVIKATNPDVICFQELDVSVTETQMKNRLQGYFPGTTWYINLGKADGSNAGVSNRNAIASRYPLSLLRDDTIPASALRGVTMALVDLPNATYAKDLYVMSIHFKAGGETSDHQSRQKHADAITNWMRDARTAGGNINLPTGTPMMVVGDTNFAGVDQSPYHGSQTMLDGSIYVTGTFGASSEPDWDGTDNADASVYDYNNGEPYTHGSTNPGTRIDRFYYTDSAMHKRDGFVFNTQTMNAAARTAAGNLLTNDTSGASDHLPIAADFALGAAAPGKLLINEFCANDVGTDDRSFIELINTSGEEIHLDAPVDYRIKTSLPLPTSPPGTTNEEFDFDLKGVVPPNGGLFVLYDAAVESVTIKSTVESNLPKLNRQSDSTFMMRNQDYSALALVQHTPVAGQDKESTVEAYAYGALNTTTNRYFKLNSNSETINLGSNRLTNFGAGEVGNDSSLSRNIGTTVANNFGAWTVGTSLTPGAPNSSTENIIDNSDSGFSASSNWSSGTSAADKYGTDYRFRLTESTSDVATWNFSVPLDGNYEIYAWWSQGANRSSTAPFIMPDSSVVYKNQQTNGGSWQSLGTLALTAGTHQVQLSCWTINGTIVVGDAIRVFPR